MTQTDRLMDTLESRARRREDRRAFFTAALGAAAVGAGAFAFSNPAAAQTVTDADVLNFALNLEYLEANFYAYAATGSGLASADTAPGSASTTTVGTVTPGKQVSFADPLVAAYAREIAADELAHVRFLRGALSTATVAQPALDLGFGASNAFSAAAQAAGLVPAGTAFDPYSSDNNFLLGAFIFEDVGVTAYTGAAALITNKTFLEAAAGILAVEAYHAAMIRETLYRKGVTAASLIDATEAISRARDSLDGGSDLDQGIAASGSGSSTIANIAPLDGDGIAFSRATGQVLNIVYLNRAAVTMGGFFPAGVNGNIKTSAAS
jgi:hypothetical protein